MPAFRDLVLVGRVVKPQGRRGEVAVQPLSDHPDRFPSLRRAFVPAPGGEAREVRVTGCWPHKGRFVLAIEGVSSIDEAEGLRGVELRIAEDELQPLPAGSFYHHQLAGLRVLDGAGASLGTVREVLDAGAGAPVLAIDGPEGELLVPLAFDFVSSIDLARGSLVVRRPEYVVAD